MKLPDLEEIEQCAQLIYTAMQPSPQLSWPLLNRRCGTQVWVKHENHNPTGAFKVRGGLIYVERLMAQLPETNGICAATRGNHGQSVAYCTQRKGLRCVIVVPFGNCPDKNACMRAFGAELVEFGQDFDAALEHAQKLAIKQGLHFMPSLDGDLIPGVATYALEFFRGTPLLDRVYVPVGLGSGILGVLAAKTALQLDTEIIGVVAEQAAAYQLSFEAGRPISTNTADTLADGLAVRNPSGDALALMLKGVSRIVSVTDAEVLHAMGVYFSDTHNIAEGAGAAALAGLLKDRLHEESETAPGRSGVVLSGGNVNPALFAQALASLTTTGVG